MDFRLKFLFACAFCAILFVNRALAERGREILARVTVYWSGPSGSDYWTRRFQSATGVRLARGHCAVDPRTIPYFSRVVLPDGKQLLAVDTGSAVRAKRASRGRVPVVDVYFPTRREALSWDIRTPDYLRVRVLPPKPRKP